eukprot:CAMPEP_0181340924 /NCGR_PEP_ID=MMETSP1101-20121128/30116_1 /TAXON_ID=46948 /ORGANISM="Rhodomonas abbreviata, Strain Caron Lab Isolate" /LENGTH=360 /DNA_ID=CAMNT_0023452127 /DNA_START=192 /DNA_END=1270 /DNA_ORIENTATION=-
MPLSATSPRRSPNGAVMLSVCLFVVVMTVGSISPGNVAGDTLHMKPGCMNLRGGMNMLLPDEMKQGTRKPKEGERTSAFDAKNPSPQKKGVYLDSPLARMMGLTQDDVDELAAERKQGAGTQSSVAQKPAQTPPATKQPDPEPAAKATPAAATKTSGSSATQPKPADAKAPSPAKQGFFGGLMKTVEKVTGYDLDGDGNVGSKKAPSTAPPSDAPNPSSPPTPSAPPKAATPVKSPADAATQDAAKQAASGPSSESSSKPAPSTTTTPAAAASGAGIGAAAGDRPGLGKTVAAVADATLKKAAENNGVAPKEGSTGGGGKGGAAAVAKEAAPKGAMEAAAEAPLKGMMAGGMKLSGDAAA